VRSPLQSLISGSMASLATVNGLATGIDFKQVVDQIMAIENSRLNYLRRSIAEQESKKSGWEEVRGLLEAIDSTNQGLDSGEALDQFAVEVAGEYADHLSVSASSDAVEGRHSVRVLQVAERAARSSAEFDSRSDALGMTGQIVFRDTVLDVDASDSLLAIASSINQANTGTDAIGVSAAVVGSSGSYRLILSADETGAAGLSFADVDGVMQSLGLVGGDDELKHRTGGGFATDQFTSDTQAVGTLLGFSSGAPADTVSFADGITVSLDLATQSLSDIRDAINAAASVAGSATFATTSEVEAGVFRLEITGAAEAADSGGVLTALGVVQANASSVAQVVTGGVLTSDSLGTPATASTALADLFNGGSTAGVAIGDTIQLQGSDDQGSSFAFSVSIEVGDTLQTLIDRLEGVEGFGGSASVAVSSDGRLTVTSGSPGPSLLSLTAYPGNEGGGILDLGTFGTTTQGRSRLLSEGRDAVLEVDGVLVSSSSNQIDEAVSGVTFTAVAADPAQTLEVQVVRDDEAGVDSMTSMVDSINALFSYVGRGIGEQRSVRTPLAGESGLRQLRNRIAGVLSGVETAGASGTIRLFDVGIEITRDGTYEFDSSAFAAQVQDDSSGVRTLVANLLSELDDVIDPELEIGSGSISGRIDRLDDGLDRVEATLFNREQRLETRREQLLMQYTKLEQSISLLQGQQRSLAAVAGSLPEVKK
jgi:flagellar hook-associated protein 2